MKDIYLLRNLLWACFVTIARRRHKKKDCEICVVCGKSPEVAKLKELFGLEDVNQLPISFYSTWY